MKRIIRLGTEGISAGEVTKKEWDEAQAEVILQGHRRRPPTKLIVPRRGGERHIEIRADNDGNLFLEFDE
jgi:hypothetical protein